jgi:hypothetical protein
MKAAGGPLGSNRSQMGTEPYLLVYSLAMIKRFLSVQRVLVLSLWLPLAGSALAQSSRVPSESRSMITRPVDETQLKALLGSTRPEANALNDRGRVDDGMVFDHLFLQLRRPPEQELALNRLIDALHDPSSPNFHKWLTAAEFGAYGLAEPDLNVITAWMGSHGLKVNGMYNNNVLIDFAATAGRLREAFHVEIDRLIVDGVPHFANMSDPLVPSALAVAVVGVVSLNDFFPRQSLCRASIRATCLRTGRTRLIL